MVEPTFIFLEFWRCIMLLVDFILVERVIGLNIVPRSLTIAVIVQV